MPSSPSFYEDSPKSFLLYCKISDNIGFHACIYYICKVFFACAEMEYFVFILETRTELISHNFYLFSCSSSLLQAVKFLVQTASS